MRKGFLTCYAPHYGFCMMRFRDLFTSLPYVRPMRKSITAITVAVTACSMPVASKTSETLFSSRWIAADGNCSTRYVSFSKTKIQFVRPAEGSSSELLVKQVIDGTAETPTAMFIVSLTPADAAQPEMPKPTSSIAIALALRVDRINLIGDGDPEKLTPAKPDSYTYRMFDLQRCSASGTDLHL